MNLIDNVIKGNFRNQILITSLATALRLLLEKNIGNESYRQVGIVQLFTKMSEILASGDKGKGIEHSLINTISIIFFENDSVVQAQIEKYINSVLFTKYEYQIGQNPSSKDPTHTLSKVSLPQFLQFFQRLSNKNQAAFKTSIAQQCDIKSVSNKNDVKLSSEKSQIMLKESVFNEFKKTVTKDRLVFKSAQKVLQISSDKQLKTHIQNSKKVLLLQIPENSRANFVDFLKSLISNTAPLIEAFNGFVTAQATQTPYIVEKVPEISQNNSQQQILEMLSKLSQAYPAYSVLFIPDKQDSTQPSFFSWYIKDFLVSQMLTKTSKVNTAEDEEQKKETFEVSFAMKPLEALNLLKDHVIRFTNRLTAYNHNMTLNEQLIKHQLRTKLIIEALSILQKVLKDKSATSRSSIKSKFLILTSLSVIEALINSQNLAVKTLRLGNDNFLNSLRYCFVREPNNANRSIDQAPKKDLPQSLLKCLDELLSEYVDVALPSNADIVTKSVSILKIMADFIANEKKRQEESLHSSRNIQDSREEAKLASPRMSPRQAHHDEAMSEDSSSEESIELQQQQQPQPMLIDDGNQDEEDDIDEDDDEEHLHQNDDEEDEPLEEMELFEGEDEYDQEDEDEEDEEIIDMGWNHRVVNRQAAANPANDIIIFNPDAGNQRQHPWGHNQIIHHYGNAPGYRARGAVANPGVDWSQEEIEVQRILGNLGNNRPAENPRRPQAINALERDLGIAHRYGAYRAPNQPRDEHDVQDAVFLKKGIIDSTFEELKVMTDFELSKMVSSQQISIDKEMTAATTAQVESVIPGQNPIQRNDRERQLLDEIRRMRRVVDEIDEEEYNPFRAMAHRMDVLGAGDNEFLNQILHRDGMFLGRYDMGMGGANPLDHFRRGPQPAAGQIGGDDDQSLFLNSSSQAIQSLNQQSHLNNQLADQILTGLNVQIEEEQAQPVQPQVLQPPAFSNRSQAANPLSDPSIFNFLNPGGAGAGALGQPQVQLQSLNEMFNQMANILNNVPEVPASVIEQPPAQLEAQAVIEQVSPHVIEPSEVIIAPVQQAQDMEDVSAFADFVEQQPSPVPVQEPSSAQVEASVVNVQEAIMEEVQVAQEENKQAQVEEEKKQEEQQPAGQQEQIDAPGTTFGYDNELLLAYGLDPETIGQIPEDLRNELFASLDLPPPNRAQPAQQQPSQQQPGTEESKSNPLQQPAGQAQPAYAALAQELGLDAEFLANIPEDMRMELIQQRQRELQPPVRQAEQMDLPSFIATVTDRNLRREIFMNMDEATLNSLPPPLMAEGRQIRDYIQNDRVRREAQLQERERLEAAIGGGGLFGGNRGRREREELEREQQRLARGQLEKTLEEIVNLRQIVLANEAPNDDLIASINSQILQDEKIIEVFLVILLANDKIECDLIPTLLSLIKIQNSHGVPVIRNKLVNAITFIIKSLSVGDDQALKEFLPKVDFKKKQSVLLMIGCLRLLLKQNKSLMKYILKGLVSREESKGTQILRRQLKAMQLKQPMLADSSDQVMTNVENTDYVTQIDTKSRPKTILYAPPAPLAEIFSLIKSDLFKQDRSLMRNLTLLIHQILKQFDIARQELEQSTQQISQETISTIAEVLSLENIDQHMMEDLGDFFFKISKQKKQNFSLISDYCLTKSTMMLEKLTKSLCDFVNHFEEIKIRVFPDSKTLGLGIRQMSSISDQEEEKVPGDFAMARMISTMSSVAGSKQKATQVKLDPTDERELKQHLKIYSDSEVLYRIYKLFNMFYDKFSAEAEAKKDEAIVIQTSSSQPADALKFVKETYQNDELRLFIQTLTDVLRIVMKVNFEPNETISNLIFCVLTSFYPELFDANKHELEMKEQEKKEREEKKDNTKYQIKMKPLTSTGDQVEKFTLLRHQSYFTNRIEEMSNFCLINKRIINKMIKTKPGLFTHELDGFVKYMPNLLDFENKRSYFKKEIHKMKRGNDMYGGSVQLYIRRDDILHDAFTQIRDKTANELKGRLHISFTGERGQDAGGLTRDFFIELSREMFNPNYSLFILSSSGSTYLPNPKSYVEVDHLRYFKFIGRMLGKALFDECLLECYFVKSFYKIMLGETLTLVDIEDFDKDFYDNMKWCLENDVECLMTTFVAVTDYFGKEQEVDLIENGKNIQVTNQNKREYVEKLAYFKMYKEIQKQVDNFLEGFYELIPKELVGIFNYKELELLISGLPNFDLEDLKQNTEYHGYNANSPQVQWLWEVLEVLDSSDRAEFLQFVTGSSKVPLDGFKGLIGMRGPQKFTIAKVKTEDIMRLPSGHTCFNQIDLPEYPSKEILHERLMIAIKETKGFGFA